MRQFTSPLDCWRLASRKASWSLNPVVSLEVRGGDFPGGLQTSAVAQLCPILYNLMDCSLPGSSIHGIFQARKSTGVGCHFLLQGIPLTQGPNPHLRHAGGFFTTEPPGSGSTFCSFKIPTSHWKLEWPSKWRRPCRTSLTLSTLQGKGRQWGFNTQGAGQGPYSTRLIHHKCVQQLQPRQTGDVLLYKVSLPAVTAWSSSQHPFSYWIPNKNADSCPCSIFPSHRTVKFD